ncbi:hypothetical protein BDZ88DRAFT_422960 [Geranomyces variabilis]|nr:hypothetical protein BDZ88DRAFT_422960 [Geranomyces variabilis]KAJ3132023.1 hypothetical protein HDU90_007574 [Geranomyces variabilis]
MGRKIPEAQWQLLSNQVREGVFNPLAFAQATRLTTEGTCKNRIEEILALLKKDSFAANYPYEEDSGWVAHWVAKRAMPRQLLEKEAAQKRGADWLALDSQDAMNERKKARLAPTPIKKSYVVPALTDGELETVSASSSDVGDDECANHSSANLLKASLAGLGNLPESERTIIAGVDMHRLLANVQKATIKRNIRIPKGDLMRHTALYLATRSCILLDEVMPAEYKAFITEQQYCALLQELRQWSLAEPAASRTVKSGAKRFMKAKASHKPFRCKIKLQNGRDEAKANDEAGVLEALYKRVKTIDPHQISEATFIARYVWPLMGLVESDTREVELEYQDTDAQHRPDLRIYQIKRFLKQTLCDIEIKTRWSAESDRAKETARVIEKVMSAYRQEIKVIYNHLKFPKLAVTVQDTVGKVYHVFCFPKLFLAFYAGKVSIITKSPSGRKPHREISRAICQWQGLAERLDEMQLAAKTTSLASTTAEAKLLPPNPLHY